MNKKIMRAWAITNSGSKRLDLKKVFKVRDEALFWNKHYYGGKVVRVRVTVEPIKRKKKVK